MDLLQRELKRKKESLLKAKEEASANSGGDARKKRKYLKVSDLRRIEEEEQEEKERKRWRQRHKNKSKKTKSSDVPASSSSTSVEKSGLGKECDAAKSDAMTTTKKKSTSSSSSNSQTKDSSTTASPNSSLPLSTTKEKKELDNTSPASITRKLRQMGLVIRYFGEGNTVRFERLKKALEQQSKTLEGLSELEEFRLGKGHGIRNPFLAQNKQLKKDQQHLTGLGFGGDERSSENARLLEKEKSNDDDNEGTKGDLEGENEEDQSDPPKIIYKYLKVLLKEWERELAERPESITRSVAGRNESKTLKQCKDYIRPLFKLLKSRRLEDGLQFHLLKIVGFAKEGEFVRAHDSYLDMAIGRAAWPIGVTMVGIHARSGRAKIESSNVAHVMNSELQRKYLTSVKRLLTFDQKRRTDVDPSKKVT
jgi:pre-mRNA-splicing factor 18